MAMRGELIGRYVGAGAYDFTDDQNKHVVGITVYVAVPNDGRSGSMGYGVEAYTAAADLRAIFANLTPLAEVCFQVEARPGQKKFRIVGVKALAKAA